MSDKKTQAELEAQAAEAKRLQDEADAAELARLQAEEDEAKAAAAEGARTVTKVSVRAVSGSYYDYSTKTHFPQYEAVEAELNTWLQLQLDAGYIEKA